MAFIFSGIMTASFGLYAKGIQREGQIQQEYYFGRGKLQKGILRDRI